MKYETYFQNKFKFSPDAGAAGGQASAGNSGNTAGGGSASAAPAPGAPAPGAGSGANGSAGAGAQAAGASAAGNPDWTTGFNDELKGFVQNKGFKDPAMVLDSYRNLEKLVGASPDKVIKLTDNWDKDIAVQNEIFQKLGKPLSANDYQIDIPTEGGSKEMADWAKGVFHEANLTKSQAAIVAAKWNEHAKGLAETNLQALQQKGEADSAALKKEWGASYEQEMKQARAAAKEYGLKSETIDQLEKVMGHSEVMKFFSKIGKTIGEDNFTSGGKGSLGGMSPEAATQQIKTYMADPTFAAKYLAGDAEAKLLINKLHEYAAHGQNISL